MHIAVELTRQVDIIVVQNLNKKVCALAIITIIDLSNLTKKITFRIKRTELYELREVLESYVFEYERELFSADEFKPTATIKFEEFFDLYTLHVKVRDLCEEVFGH